jgi:hypothetical protein
MTLLPSLSCKKKDHPNTRRKISLACNKLEDIIRIAKNSSGGLDLLHSGLCDLESVVSQSTLPIAHTSHEEQESFVGSSFPTQVDILTPTSVDARGTCSRNKGHIDKEKKVEPKKKIGVTIRVPRICGTCKNLCCMTAASVRRKNEMFVFWRS